VSGYSEKKTIFCTEFSLQKSGCMFLLLAYEEKVRQLRYKKRVRRTSFRVSGVTRNSTEGWKGEYNIPWRMF